MVPRVVLDKSMYEPSRIMRSIQYIFDQNVLRIWNDAVLLIEDKDEFGEVTPPRALFGAGADGHPEAPDRRPLGACLYRRQRAECSSLKPIGGSSLTVMGVGA